MTTHRSIMLTLLALVLSIGLGASRSMGNSGIHGADDSITTVTLRSTVRLAHDNHELTLADLATITGPQVASLQTLAIANMRPVESGKWTPLKIGTIRMLIDQAPAIHAGSVVIVGNDLSITRRQPPSTQTLPSRTIQPEATAYEGPILRDHIKQWIYSRLHTNKDTTRIEFETRNQDLLDAPTADRVIEIAETGRSTKMHLRITIYQADRIIISSSIRVDVQIQRSVRVASKQISRRAVIDPEISAIEARWLSPIVPIADPTQSLGLESKTVIKPGTIILSTMLTQPILVKRGQLVSAKSLVGRAIVTKIVRAKDSGQLGDLIELESKDRTAHFTARIAGPGQVIIVQTPQKPVKSAKDHP